LATGLQLSISTMLERKRPAATAGPPPDSPGLGLAVRHFTAADLDHVVRIENASFPIDAFSESDFRRLHSAHPHEFLVAEISGQVVGYVVGSVAGGCGQIESLAVDDAARRRGIGALLVRRLLDRFRETGLRTCRLEVRTENPVAIDLYERLGFRVVGRRRRYYPNGGDALVMEKVLARRSTPE
jgi:ribosomal-protein-alanine N-acetyltransferase